MKISKHTARKFVLGKQGLWPGRRWSGLSGTADALHQVEAVQLDPLNVISRSHDIVLCSRVLGYTPEMLYELMYAQRAFFDYGGGLFVYPMAELPYWRVHMQRCRDIPRWARFAAEHPGTIQEVKEAIRTDGPLGNRDFKGNHRVTGNYRGRKDTSLALYYLWLTGELLIHQRNGFDRVYDFLENVAPVEFQHVAAVDETERYFARKAISFKGLLSEREWINGFSDFIRRRLSQDEATTRLEGLIDSGMAARLEIDGSQKKWLCLAEDLLLLEALEAGQMPTEWAPLGTTTEMEMVFLAPLDIVSARGRSKWLFEFEYIWEVYKPAATRRWGYYTLPVLWGDRLVARFDSKLDRGADTYRILGYWSESDVSSSDPAFAAAFASALDRFTRFLPAARLDLTGISDRRLRQALRSRFNDQYALETG